MQKGVQEVTRRLAFLFGFLAKRILSFVVCESSIPLSSLGVQYHTSINILLIHISLSRILTSSISSMNYLKNRGLNIAASALHSRSTSICKSREPKY